MSRPFIPAPNTASVEFIYNNTGQISENVIHVEKGSPFTLAQLQALRGTVDTWDSGQNSHLRTTGVTLFRIRTKALDSLGSPMEDYFLPTPRPGTITSATVPMNVAFCMKLSSGLTGRSNRGRWYAGNFGIDNTLDPGHMTAGSVSGFVGAMNNLLTTLSGAGYTWVVTSYRTGGAWRTTAHNVAVATVVAVDNVLDSQRRRLPGRGH